MIRATVITALRSYLAANYAGPVTILKETSTADLVPPYAVIRVGSGEQLYPGVAEIWDLNILVGVFQDADTTTAADAEAAAAAVFAALDDPTPIYSASDATLVWSNFERTGTEASIVENRWQHVAVFNAIVAPVA
jgi:hypothetical protein